MSRLAVGIGMLPRGEVGLIFAGIGATLVVGGRPLFDQSLFSAVVLMVLVTTIVAPAGLRWTLERRREGPPSPAAPATIACGDAAVGVRRMRDARGPGGPLGERRITVTLRD